MSAQFLRSMSLAARVIAALAMGAGGSAFAQDLDGDLIQDSLELRQGALDCNHDGILDTVDIGRPHFASAIEHLNGVAQFQNSVWDVTPIDFNSDGRMDLAFTIFFSTNEGRIALWRNDGGPGLVFQSEIAFPNARPYSIAAADMNADGLADLVASDASYNRVYVLRATGPGTFAPAVVLQGDTSNNGSVGVAVGDLDNDGDLDVAATSWETNKVNVWKNNGNATFTPRQTFAVSYQPRDIAIGDFTGDGFADLATANEFYYAPGGADGTVSLLANTGTGAFVSAGEVTPPRGLPPYRYQPYPRFVELFDIDHDGDRDLIVTSKMSNTVSVHHNDGAGVFTLAQQFGGFPIEQDPCDVDILDLDGDGWEEVVFGDQDESGVTVLRNDKGVLARHQNYASSINGAMFVGLVDLTGDGLAEIVSSNDASRTFSVLVNKGALVFDAAPRIRPVEYGGSGVLGEFTSDGKTDYVQVMQNTLGEVTSFGVFAGIGAVGEARFEETPIVTPHGQIGYGVTPFVRDFNHDGKADLLTIGGPTAQAAVYFGNGDGTFAAPVLSPISPRVLRLTIADYNNDGELDLMWMQGGHPGFGVVSFGDGAGHFGPTTQYTMLREDEAVATGDITGDGVPEFFGGFRQQLAPPAGGVLSWLVNNGDGTFGSRQDRFITSSPLNPPVLAIAVADFDGDKDNDVIVSAQGLRLYRNPGDGNLPATPEFVSQTNASILFATDIDQDGDIDLYARNATLSIVLNNGDGTFLPAMHMHQYDFNYRNMFVADANNDGRSDAMIRPENSWSQYFFLNFAPASVDRNENGIPDECEGRCRTDINLDDAVNSTDVSDFINMWFIDQANGSHDADFDANGSVNSTDVSEFINVWFAEVANGCGE